jgi:hypothetical protein
MFKRAHVIFLHWSLIFWELIDNQNIYLDWIISNYLTKHIIITSTWFEQIKSL